MTDAALPEYRLHALRYATRAGRRRDNFLGGDPHDGPMTMDYYVWVAVAPDGTAVAIDTGFNAEVAAQRGRTFLRDPVDSLQLLDVDPAQLKHVILTHLHYDHVGNLGKFPAATFHIQEAEVHYATGRYMHYPRLSHSFEANDVCDLIRLNFAQRVLMYRAGAEIAPGITVHPTGGHSAGLQFVRVNTRRGWVVLASDVTHYYENMERGRPFPTAFHVGEMLEGFDALRAAAPSEDAIVPGHDPEVMRRYPAPKPELDGIVVTLDVPPTPTTTARQPSAAHA